MRVAVIKAEKGASIADDPTKRGRCEREYIHVNEDYELRNWAKTFGVSPEEIKRAVEQVGDRAEAVRQHLRK